MSEHGCDSVTTITFTCESYSEEVIGVCDSVVWNGLTFSMTTYLWTSTNLDGCTAEVLLDLTFIRPMT